MQNKYPAWVAGIVGALVIIGIVFALLRSSSQTAQAPSDEGSQNTSKDMMDSGSKNGIPDATTDGFSGTLKASDTPTKGNLMLVMTDHTVYLRTSRDYSDLLDKEVNVEIDGDLEAFELVDITARN